MSLCPLHSCSQFMDLMVCNWKSPFAGHHGSQYMNFNWKFPMPSKGSFLLVSRCPLNDTSVTLNDSTTYTVPVEEIEALLQFKAHLTSTSQSQLLSTWDPNTSTTICGGSWRGVECTNLINTLCTANVRSINLHGVGLTGTIAPHLGNLSQLTVLDLSSSYLFGSIPAQLSSATNLNELRLHSNQLIGSIPPVFSSLEQLKYLDLHSNHLTGSILNELSLLEELLMIDLSDNQLTGTIPHILTSWTNMVQLELSYNQLIGTIPIQMGLLQRLERLSLHHNNFSGSIPTDLGNCQRLSILKLNSNQLTDVVPDSLGVLKLLQFMDFSENQLRGGIPESLGNCRALKDINLSYNQLNGDLPERLHDLSSLETIDVSSNNLAGALSPYLESLQNLHFLNVSFNNFAGIIPSSGVFKLLNATSFLGNPKLCGPLLHVTCDLVHDTKVHRQRSISSPAIAGIAISCTVVLSFALVICCYLTISRKMGTDSARPTGNIAIELPREPRRFTADELQRATGGYSEDNIIGKGGVCVVYRGVLANGETIAVKKLKEVISKEALLKEIEILSQLRHRNIIRIVGCVFNMDVNAIVMKYMSNGSLEQYLVQHRDRMTWNMLIDVVTSVAEALVYLHHEYGVPIIHGDVKPSNILLDNDFVVHLADFGIAKLQIDGVISMSSSNILKGSIGYMAPEYAYGAKATIKGDVYSFGVVVLELLTCKKPTQLLGGVTLRSWVKLKWNGGVGLREVLAPSLMYNRRVNVDRLAPQLLEIGLACTNEHPKNRPSMQDVVSSLFNINNILK